MLETEYKSMIDKKTYYLIEDMYKWDFIKEQTNYYYSDANGTLYKNGITFRIREKDNIKKIQVKKHYKSKNDAHASEETEFETDIIPKYIENSKKYIGIDAGRLIKMGSLVTLRHSFMWNATTEICLDKNMYLDMTDYEIEVEYTGEEPSDLIFELNKLDIDFKQKTGGKYSRFMSRAAQEQNR